MDCDKAIYRVYGYLDGELTVWRRWTIKRHLHRCPPCAKGYDFEVDSNVVDVFVGYLRRKLEAGGEPRLLHTVRGVGFVLRAAS